MNIRYPLYEGVYRILTYLFVYYGLYPLYFTSVYIWYGTKVKWFPYNTANSENRV